MDIKKRTTKQRTITDSRNIKQDVLLILVLVYMYVRQQNFLNCKPHVLQLLKHVIKSCEKVYERSGKNLFWSIRYSDELKISLKLEISMRLVCLLPQNLIKDKLIDIIEITFNREDPPYLACNDRNAFLHRKKLKDIMHGLVKRYVMR